MYFINKALEYIFLPSCGVCEKLGDGYLCKKCEKDLKKYTICVKDLLIDLKTCNEISSSQKKQSLEKDINKIEKFHVLKYQELIRKLIIQYKFNDKPYLYKTFCEIIVKNKKAFEFIKNYDIIIPVPIHKKRMRERGYNQSELIAREIAKNAQIKCYKDVLIKTKNNKPQSTISGKSRKENTKNVYKLINHKKISNKNILLFDDIYTTGATVKECIKELKKANIKKIGIITLAKD